MLGWFGTKPPMMRPYTGKKTRWKFLLPYTCLTGLGGFINYMGEFDKQTLNFIMFSEKLLVFKVLLVVESPDGYVAMRPGPKQGHLLPRNHFQKGSATKIEDGFMADNAWAFVMRAHQGHMVLCSTEHVATRWTNTSSKLCSLSNSKRWPKTQPVYSSRIQLGTKMRLTRQVSLCLGVGNQI